MPSGRVHEAINLSVLGLLTVGYLSYGTRLQLTEPLALAFSSSYLLGTFLVTPDLDLAEKNVNAKGRWGVLGLFWIPYGWMFSHRGLSHTWLVGPLTRLLYMATAGTVLYWAAAAVLKTLQLEFDLKARLHAPAQEIVWCLVLGYYASQWLHLIADGIWPDHGLRASRRRR